MDIYYNELAERVYKESLFTSSEEKLAYLIMKQRFVNLCKFIEKQKQKYEMKDEDIEELKELWFLYNDLKELNFIGTDIFSNVLFVRHRIPFLYRSVGKDSAKRVLEGKNHSDEVGSTLIKECLEQIKSGGQGKLFSYSKCFGKMLIKYANIVDEKTTIEIRENSWINSISSDGNNCYSIQKYIRENSERNQDIDIPLFMIDMSNAREDKVSNLKIWINTYLGEQSYVRRYNDIYDPIGDAEVVTNFTGDLKNSEGNDLMCDQECRYDLSIEEFCILLYKYAFKYAENDNRTEYFNAFINRSIQTMPNHETNLYYIFYNNIINDNKECSKAVSAILEKIDWSNEKKYMTRVKAEKSNSNEKMPAIDVYKESNAEIKSRIWKDIIFEALRGNYEYINCENLI